MAATFTKAELIALFPEFAGTSEARILAMQEMAKSFVNEAALGDDFKVGLELYTAHMLSSTPNSAQQAGVAGALTSTRVGDLSRTYAAPTGSDKSALATSSYGQLYLKLIQGLGAGGYFTQAKFPAC